MKVGSVQGFGARFTPECSLYLAKVKEQAIDSGRMDEYKDAKSILAFNFPRGVIKKEISRRYQDDIFSFKPNQEIRFSFRPNGKNTNELDSFIKLSKEIKKISL